jgi:hypothetical protein
MVEDRENNCIKASNDERGYFIKGYLVLPTQCPFCN